MSAPLGFVYVLLNASFPDQFKIGASINHPHQRAKQLSAGSGVPTPFTVVYFLCVRDPFQVEAAVHRALKEFRVNESREFFRVSLAKIIHILEQYDELIGGFHSAHVDTPWGDLFATFPDDGSPRNLTEDEKYEIDKLVYFMSRENC